MQIYCCTFLLTEVLGVIKIQYIRIEIASTLLLAGAIIYIINLSPLPSPVKTIFSIVLIFAMLAWMVYKFPAFNSIKSMITNLFYKI